MAVSAKDVKGAAGELLRGGVEGLADYVEQQLNALREAVGLPKEPDDAEEAPAGEGTSNG